MEDWGLTIKSWFNALTELMIRHVCKVLAQVGHLVEWFKQCATRLDNMMQQFQVIVSVPLPSHRFVVLYYLHDPFLYTDLLMFGQ